MLATVVIRVVLSVAAIGYLLAASKSEAMSARLGNIVLAIATVGLSWLLMRAKFGFHYANSYYRTYAVKGDKVGEETILNFPGKRPPDYVDFLYFSYVIDMTSQVSDVTINTRAMRRLALLHGLISFAFNLMIVAFFINVLGAVL